MLNLFSHATNVLLALKYFLLISLDPHLIMQGHRHLAFAFVSMVGKQ